MSKGYLLFAVNSKDVDYVKMAYACALSIKNTQPDGYNNVSLVAHNADDLKHKYPIFDHVIEYTGPTGMDVRSRGYDYSPYDETVLLDSDQLLLNPLDHWWDAVKNKNLFVATAPRTYRNRFFKYGYYRKVFKDAELPDVYSAWTYFKKSEESQEFFELVKLITDNPQHFKSTMLTTLPIPNIPTDEAFALAIKLLDLDGIATDPSWKFPSITHMKAVVQGWNSRETEWVDKIRFTINQQGQVKLGVWQQTDLLHYVNKSIITDEVIEILERANGF